MLNHFRQNWIELHQTKTKMITGQFYTYRQIHFISGNASCFWYSVISNYLRGPNVTAIDMVTAVPVAVHLLVTITLRAVSHDATV